MQKNSDYLTMKATADELGVTYSSVAKWVLDRKLRVTRIGRSNYVHLSDVEQMKQRREARHGRN